MKKDQTDISSLFQKEISSDEELRSIVKTFLQSVQDADIKIFNQHLEQLSEFCENYPLNKELGLNLRDLVKAQFGYFTTDFQLAILHLNLLEERQAGWKDHDLKGMQHFISGGSYRSMGDLDKATDDLLKALEFINPLGPLGTYSSYAAYILGGIFSELLDYAAAYKYYSLGMEGAQKAGNKDGEFRLLSGMAVSLLREGKLDESKEIFEEAVEKASNEAQQALALHNMALFHFKKENYTKAEELVKKAYQVRTEYGYEDAASTSQILLARIKLEQNELDESISQLKKALETASRLAVNTKQRDAHLYLSKCYEKQEKWKEAYIHLDAFKKINLNIFSNQQIEISRLKNRELEKQRMQIQEMHEELKDSIVYSKRIQTALLPPDESIVNMGYDSFVLYLPKDIVAGDFYWMEKIGEDLLIAVADCTGHGVPGAMVSVVCHNALNRAVREFELREPGAILDKVNQLVQQTFAQSSEKVKDGMDISFLRLNQHQKIYQWAGANNPLYILREGIEEMEVIKGDKQPIGHYDHTEQFQNHQLNVMTGDQLYLFTDGFADQFGGPKLKKYKYSPFKRMLSSLRSLKTEEQKVAIEGEFNSWKGNQEQVDDVCIWGVKI